MSEGKSPLERMEERAWASFALHTGQRLTTFNFFIVLSSLLVGAMVTTFQKDFRVPHLGVVVGGMMTTLSFIFWRIDVRNRELVKLAEKVIIYFEALAPKPEGTDYHPAAFFLREVHETEMTRARLGWSHFSYAKAFNAVYILVACTGIAGAGLALEGTGKDARPLSITSTTAKPNPTSSSRSSRPAIPTATGQDQPAHKHP